MERKVVCNEESLHFLKVTKEALTAASMAIGIHALEKRLEGISEPSATEAANALNGLKEGLDGLIEIYDDMITKAEAYVSEEANSSSWS